LHYGSPQRLFWNPWKHSFYAFFVTQPARGTATPLFDVFTGTPDAKITHGWVRLVLCPI
jgi:hypothetical protein